MCPVYEEKNLLGARWSKLLINATFSGLRTVVGGTFGDVLENSGARKLAVRCMKECIDEVTRQEQSLRPCREKMLQSCFIIRVP